MKLQDFTGGLNTRLRPQFIGVNEGAVYSNIDNAVGSLQAVAGSTASGINTKKFAKFFDEQFLDSDIRRDYANLLDTIYWTDGIAPRKFDGITENNLGITQPTAAPTVTTRDLENPIEARLEVASGGDLPADILHYRLVNFDAVYYSGAFDVEVNANNNKVQLNSSLLGEFNTVTTVEGVESGSSPVAVFTSVLSAAVTTKQVTISDVSGITYGASGVLVFRQFEGKWRLLGTLATDADTIVDNVHDISANAELDSTKIAPIVGTIQYLYTFYNSSEGVESAVSSISPELATLGASELTGLAISSDPQVDKKRIYRVGGNISTFSLVAEIVNTSTTYSDKLKDTSIIGTVLTSADNNAPLANLQFLTEAYAMLFAASGTKLFFTPIGKPDAWPSLNFLEFSTPITGIAAASNGLLVFTEFKTFIVFGTSPTSLSQQQLSGDQGCIAAASVQELKGSVVWVSSDGVCISNGSDVTVVSRDKLNKITLLPIDSIIHDEIYYVVEASGSILAFDLRFAPTFKNLSLNIFTFVVAEDILYGWRDGELYTLFTSSTNESMSFTSARLVEGRITEEKTYKKIYIYSKGDIILTVLINDKVVLTKELTGEASTQMQVPQENQRGEFIQFNVTGTGEVYEIEYEVGRGHGHGN